MEADILFQKVFGAYIELNQSHLDFLKAHFHPQFVKARTKLLSAGEVERYFYLVQSGVHALYLIDSKGEKVTLGFSFEGTVSGGYDSFILERPSTLHIEVLTDSYVIAISKTHFNALFEHFPVFYQWRAQFIEAVLFGRISRERELLTLSAEERFQAFTSRCPAELLTIPQKYLASYLNMKPETYSRLRALRH